MQVKIPRDWELPESAVTPESGYLSRRRIVKTLGLAAASPLLLPSLADAATAGFPTKLNKKYLSPKDRKITNPRWVASYNNFFEFSTQKEEPRILANRGWKTEPWTLEVGGLVEKPLKLDVNGLCKEMGLEMRIYRFRCVEAWSMVIPWDGFPLHKLIKKAKPTAKAKFVKLTTFMDKKAGPGFERYPYYDWPYTEGLRMDEAMHELSFLAVGIYGRPMPNQNGAPIRLVVPWKYGFKSIKSIVKIEFTDTQPNTLWNSAATQGIRLLLQRESGGSSSKMDSSARARNRRRPFCRSHPHRSRSTGMRRKWLLSTEGMDLKKHF